MCVCAYGGKGGWGAINERIVILIIYDFCLDSRTLKIDFYSCSRLSLRVLRPLDAVLQHPVLRSCSCSCVLLCAARVSSGL